MVGLARSYFGIHYPILLLVSHKSVNGRHMTTDLCRPGAEKKRRCLAEEEARVLKETDFRA